jgi:DNA-binding NarL/FixJ family response regulator
MARGLASLLKKIASEIVGLCNSDDELLSNLERTQPDLILFGRGLPSSPLVLAAAFESAPEARGMAIRDRITAEEVLILAAQGVIGILHADAGIAKYRACISSVLEDCQWIDPDFLAKLLNSSEKRASDLTSREMEVIDLVRRGWRNKQIARGLGITEGTVKMHLHHIFTKLNYATRTELALAAAHDGLRARTQGLIDSRLKDITVIDGAFR